MILRKGSEVGKGNMYLTENRLSRNEMLCASGNHSYISHIMCKRIFRFES